MKIEKISKGVYQNFADNELKSFLQGFFGKKEGKEYWAILSAKGRVLLFAARDSHKILGAIRLNLEYKVARIGMFVVAAGKRNQGIGSMLLAKCEQEAKTRKCVKIWLHALPSTPAYKFYLNHGYSEEARLKKHLGGKNDLCIMSKFI